MTHLDPESRHPCLLVYVVLGLVAATAVAGCGSGDAAREVERLESEVERLEDQVEELEDNVVSAESASAVCSDAIAAADDLQSALAALLALTLQVVDVLEGRDATPMATLNEQSDPLAAALVAAQGAYEPLADDCYT